MIENIFLILFTFFFFYTMHILTNQTKLLYNRKNFIENRIKLLGFLIKIRKEFFYNSKNLFYPFDYFSDKSLFIKYSYDEPFNYTSNRICISYVSKYGYVYKYIDDECDGSYKSFKLFKGYLENLEYVGNGKYYLYGVYEDRKFKILLLNPFKN